MEHVLSLSYGKDSLACLEAIRLLGWPLDRIIHAEVWATETIPADLPPMVEFKAKADAIIRERYGIEVEHVSACADGRPLTYEAYFYTVPQRKRADGYAQGTVRGWPMTCGAWCNDRLKTRALDSICGDVRYMGIAADEPKRIARHTRSGVALALVEIGWDEAYCRKWCEENGLLSPIYTSSARGGCWFCHNQSVGQLRQLRRNYPALWAMMLKWDGDSPVPFKPDGHTVRDYEKRFALEDAGVLRPGERFTWRQLDWVQCRFEGV